MGSAAEQVPPALASQLDVLGIATRYEDAFGTYREITPDVAEELVAAMGLDVGETPPDVSDRVVVVSPSRPAPSGLHGTLQREDGGEERVDGALPDLPLGYHRLLRDSGDESAVIVSPGSCMAAPASVWGWAAQVYATRSRASWGVGDLADLRRLGEWSGELGAGALLINPIDAVTPIHPRESSPYFPTSRRFRDPLYLRIEEVPGAVVVAEELAPLADLTRGLNDDRTIDRELVFGAKMRALERIWSQIADAGDEPGFRDFEVAHGQALEDFAVFCAIAETFGTGWRSWPARYRHPRGGPVQRFAAAYRDRVRFHAWVQWCCDLQLAAAGASAPLMRDLPIGFDPDGADAWGWQDLLASGVTIGAPPDRLGPQGQNWSLPAFVPHRLRADAYQPVVETLRASFRHARSLRIDHILGFFRLFWIPPGGDATTGTYVSQPTDDLFDVLALESHRAGAYVVGEDLGTVGPGVRDELGRREVLRYRVLWFEEEPPPRWGRGALGSVTTHDLPTVAGLWSGHDVAMQHDLGLDPDEDGFADMRAKLADWADVDPGAPSEEACVAAHAALARAPSAVVVAQLEDALAVRERINVPGTSGDQRANWSLALPVALEDLAEDPTVAAVAEAMGGARGGARGTAVRSGSARGGA